VGSIWKVNIKARTIKLISEHPNEKCTIPISTFTSARKGLRQPDYFIVVPLRLMQPIENWREKKLGILHW
jgi:hypothetical protein